MHFTIQQKKLIHIFEYNVNVDKIPTTYTWKLKGTSLYVYVSVTLWTFLYLNSNFKRKINVKELIPHECKFSLCTFYCFDSFLDVLSTSFIKDLEHTSATPKLVGKRSPLHSNELRVCFEHAFLVHVHMLTYRCSVQSNKKN